MRQSLGVDEDDSAARSTAAAVVQQLLVGGLADDPVLQHVVVLASALADTPSAGIHLIDDEHQHRVTGLGAPIEKVPRNDSMCRVVVDTGVALETLDATVDDRFASSPSTSGRNPVRYYASTPLHVGSTAIGTLCVWDTDDRASSRPGLLELLGDLAVIAAGHLELLHTVWVLAGEATTDVLTGLPNRRLMMDVLSWALADRRRHGTDVSVVFLDLDGFKAVNDEQGHSVGDEVLRDVGRRLAEEVREGETVGRLGGDEFLVVLRRGRHDAEEVAVRLGEALSRPIDLADGGQVHLGASAGVLVVEGRDETVDRVLLRADAAMYDVKRRRRQARAS